MTPKVGAPNPLISGNVVVDTFRSSAGCANKVNDFTRTDVPKSNLSPRRRPARDRHENRVKLRWNAFNGIAWDHSQTWECKLPFDLRQTSSRPGARHHNSVPEVD